MKTLPLHTHDVYSFPDEETPGAGTGYEPFSGSGVGNGQGTGGGVGPGKGAGLGKGTCNPALHPLPPGFGSGSGDAPGNSSNIYWEKKSPVGYGLIGNMEGMEQGGDAPSLP